MGGSSRRNSLVDRRRKRPTGELPCVDLLGRHGGPIEALAFGARGELRETLLQPPTDPHATTGPIDPIDPIGALIGPEETADDTLAAPIRHQHYRYDTLGRLVSRDTPEGRHTYRYDGLDRLVGEQGSRHGATYRFDAAGNRLTVPGTRPATPSAEDWAATVRANLHNPDFNPLGEAAPSHLPEAPATSCPDNRLQNLDGVRYRHDARGNLIERRSADGQRLTLGYDALDRLIRADRHAHGQHLLTAIYTYDVFGRRRAKFVYLVETPDAPPRLRQHARYDWDGERMISERLLTRHPDARADLGDANAWTHTERLYAYHPGTFTPLAQITCHPHNNGRVTIERIDWCHTDQIGTPHALIDKTGQNTWRIELDAWGKRLDTPAQPETPELAFTGATDPAECPIRLPGQFFDAETGLHYNRHRYYDPHAGRYVTQDPIGLMGGHNIYAYVGGNPVRYVDPSGTDIYTVHVGLAVPLVGGFDFGLMADTGWQGSRPDFGVFGTFKKNHEGLGRFKSTVGVSKTIGGRCDFDGTDAEIEIGLGEVGGSLGGIDANNIPTSLSVELGPQIGIGSSLTQTASLTIGDIARGVARAIHGSGGGAWYGGGGR